MSQNRPRVYISPEECCELVTWAVPMAPAAVVTEWPFLWFPHWMAFWRLFIFSVDTHAIGRAESIEC